VFCVFTLNLIMFRSLFIFLCTIGISFIGYSKPVNLTVSYKADSQSKLKIGQLAQIYFTPVNDIGALNFGFINCTYWVKLEWKNLTPAVDYNLLINTIVPDTIEVYELNSGGFSKKIIGEGVPSDERFLHYPFTATETTGVIYLKLVNNGQPLSLPLSVKTTLEMQADSAYDFLALGIIYGFVFLILVLNIILFLNTFERIYVYSLLFNVFSLFVLFYFDGIIKLVVFTDSLYWNNESVAIAFCGSFIFSNLYISEFLNVRAKGGLYKTLFSTINILFFIILVLSFWHPFGFNWYLIINLYLTSVEAVLLFFCIIRVRTIEQDYFVIQFIGVISLIVFGTITQLYFFGILPINFLTVHSVHFVVLPQLLIQAVALGRRLSILVSEKSQLQLSLIKSGEEYSHSLITTLEDERKRLSNEFHDGIGQNILVIRNGMLKMRKQNVTEQQKSMINEMIDLSASTLDELRMISQNLRPTILDSFGLTESLLSMIRKLNEVGEMKFHFRCNEPIDGLIAKDKEINVYRILQELTNNILKHSSASQALIVVAKNCQEIHITVEDNGIGFYLNPCQPSKPSNGLTGIKERVNILSGTVIFDSKPTCGTTVIISLPIPQL
jgi:two-component system, sensor histidine kinase LadS